MLWSFFKPLAERLCPLVGFADLGRRKALCRCLGGATIEAKTEFAPVALLRLLKFQKQVDTPALDEFLKNNVLFYLSAQ